VPDNCARERSLNFTSTASTFDVGSFLRSPTTSHSHPHHANSLPATKRSHTAPLPSQQGCGPLSTKSPSTKGIGGEGKQGGTQEVGGPLSTSRKPRYDFRRTSVFAYSSLPHPLLTTPRSSADLANDASSEHPTTTCRDKAQALAGLDRRGHPTMAHRDKASTPAVLDHQRRRRAYEPPEDKPHLAAGYGG